MEEPTETDPYEQAWPPFFRYLGRPLSAVKQAKAKQIMKDLIALIREDDMLEKTETPICDPEMLILIAHTLFLSLYDDATYSKEQTTVYMDLRVKS